MHHPVPTRSEATEAIAAALLPRASRLLRMIVAAGDGSLSRTEVGLLGTLQEGPRRVTELSRTEAVAQPTATRLVDALEQRGYVERQHDDSDRRVVRVVITPAGREAHLAVRAANSAQLQVLLESLDDDQLRSLASACESLGVLIETLRGREPR